MTADRDLSGLGAGKPPRKAAGEGHRHAPRSDEAHGLAWLPWRSCGCDHGIKGHRIAMDGSIIEVPDIKIRHHKKPKAVSARQWGRC